LAMERAVLSDLSSMTRDLNGLVESVQGPGHLVRSAEEMSRMAPFIDGGRPSDRTNWSNTVISYYPFGGAIALALDLTLRERSNGKLTLDDYMRAMWRVHGKPGGAREGYVDRPYTPPAAEAGLAEGGGGGAVGRERFARWLAWTDTDDDRMALKRE